MDVTTTKHDALEYSIADLVAIAYRRGMEGGSIDGELVAGEEPGVEPDASEENPSVRNTLANQSVRVVGARVRGEAGPSPCRPAETRRPPCLKSVCHPAGGRAWDHGQALTPSGRPKVPAEVREAAMALMADAIRTLGDIRPRKQFLVRCAARAW